MSDIRSILGLTLRDNVTQIAPYYCLLLAILSGTLQAHIDSTQRVDDPGALSVQEEVEAIDSQLNVLPKVAKEDFGGSRGGMLYTLAPPALENAPLMEIKIDWDKERAIDLLALVPARHYGINGPELQYMMPRRYDLQLLDASGLPAGELIQENDAWDTSRPQGYPYLYPLDHPQLAKSLRIRIYELAPGLKAEDALRAAWAEVFCFEGRYNAALNAEVSAPQGNLINIWRWNPSFLVDGVTGLGFPQQRRLEPGTTEIGWLSHSHPDAESEGWVELDLGSLQKIDGLRLFPAIRPSLSHVPGTGIPRRFQVLTSKSGKTDDWEIWMDFKSEPVPNPGQHPSEFRAPARSARYIRIEAVEFWKVSQFYPAFIGFSEIQVLQEDRNVALGADVRVFELSQRVLAEADYIWSPASLSDGNSIAAEILPVRDWLELLAQRHSLEQRRSNLVEVLNHTLETRRKLIAWGAASIGTAGILAAIFFFWRTRLRIRRYQHDLKTRLAGDLHDDLGSNLGCILSLSKSIEQNHQQTESYARRIRQMTTESLESIRDLVQTFREERMPGDEIPRRIEATAERMLPPLPFTFEAAPELENFPFSATDRRNLLLFVREAFHNCLQHSGASQVTLKMRLDGNDCVLEIADDGCGISPDILEKEYTLFALKARTRQLNGELCQQNEPNKGLKLILRLPPKRSEKSSI